MYEHFACVCEVESKDSCYQKIFQSLRAMRFVLRFVLLLWNLTGLSAIVQLRCCQISEQFEHFNHHNDWASRPCEIFDWASHILRQPPVWVSYFHIMKISSFSANGNTAFKLKAVLPLAKSNGLWQHNIDRVSSGQGKVREIPDLAKVREKSGNFVEGQGKKWILGKVREFAFSAI